MKVKNSQLNFEDFKIMACSFAAIPSDKKIPSKDLQNIPVDVDFDILSKNTDTSKFKILLQIASKDSKKMQRGYMFSIISEASFNIIGFSKLSKEKRDQFILYTALPLSISMVRSHLYNASASFTYGPYLLPSIDLLDLVKNKFKKN